MLSRYTSPFDANGQPRVEKDYPMDNVRQLPKGYRVVKNGMNEYWLQIREPRIFLRGYEWYDVRDVVRESFPPTLFTPKFNSEQEAIDWIVKRHEKYTQERKNEELREQITIVRENV
jgi:hypothetical protein